MAQVPYAARKIPFAKNRSLVQYSKMVGQMVFVSNTLNADFAAIFRKLASSLSQENRYQLSDGAKSVWNSLRSDDLQRTVLMAFVRGAFSNTSRDIKCLMWAIQMAGKLSEYRNDAVHTPFEMVSNSEIWPKSYLDPDYTAGAPHRIEKLNRVGYARLFRSALGDLVQLTIYVEAILARLDGRAPKKRLPRRPRLRSIQLVQQSPPKSNSHQQQKSKRKHQQRASPASSTS